MPANWPVLESNPTCFNELLTTFDVLSVQVEDVYGFEAAAFDKQPLALILCFANYEQSKVMLAEEHADLAAHGVTAPEGVFMAEQKIQNACGTFALFNALANLEGKIDLGNGEFRRWLDQAKKVGVSERSALMENNEAIKKAHALAAKVGAGFDGNAEVDNHFIAIVNKDNTIYEIDSHGAFPLCRGKTTENTFIVDAGDVIRHKMEKLNTNIYSVLALVPA